MSGVCIGGLSHGSGHFHGVITAYQRLDAAVHSLRAEKSGLAGSTDTGWRGRGTGGFKQIATDNGCPAASEGPAAPPAQPTGARSRAAGRGSSKCKPIQFNTVQFQCYGPMW